MVSQFRGQMASLGRGTSERGCQHGCFHNSRFCAENGGSGTLGCVKGSGLLHSSALKSCVILKK